jgi:hypothetical protein
VQHGDGELQALADAERQAVGPLVGDIREIEAGQQLGDPARDLGRRQMVELGVQQQVLADRQLAVEREGCDM